MAAGEEMNEDNHAGEFQGVSLLYFPVAETRPGEMFLNNAVEFCSRIAQDIDKWLSTRPLPEGHTRLFHGTRTISMNDILEHGLDQSNFEKIGDFGPAFYCADTVRASLRFGMLSTRQSAL